MSVAADTFTVTSTVQQLPDVPCKRVIIVTGSSTYIGGSNLTAGNPPTGGAPVATSLVFEELANLDEVYVVTASGTSTLLYYSER